MKKIIALWLPMMIAFIASSQTNVTQFLGIPIDGTKSAMIQKLKANGFTYNATNDILSGQFNGRNVNLHVVTNNNKVYRIMVVDAVGTSEGEIKIRFNTLCSQFVKNGKYFPQNILGDYSLADDEDISYEMTVHNKRFQAAYYQVSDADLDTTGMAERTIYKILEKYGEETWEKMSDDERQTAGIGIAVDLLLEKVSHKSVWFMITESYGRYYINIYYDNELNQANGEDL